MQGARPESEMAMIAAKLFVSETEGVSGGYPCVGNTRIPIRSIVVAYRELDDFETTVEAFPQLTSAEIRYALDWYIKHPERVDEDIRLNAQALEELRARP